jgi:hypothetical protein
MENPVICFRSKIRKSNIVHFQAIGEIACFPNIKFVELGAKDNIAEMDHSK